MHDSTTTALPADELSLARLTCAKLVGLVQGTLSIGLPALITGVPDPQVFLEERFRVMNAFAIVLHTISGKPGSQQEILRLRSRSREISSGLEHLQRLSSVLLDPSEDQPAALRSARESASALCDAIAEYGDLIDLDRTRITTVQHVVLEVFEGVERMTKVAETSAR